MAENFDARLREREATRELLREVLREILPELLRDALRPPEGAAPLVLESPPSRGGRDAKASEIPPGAWEAADDLRLRVLRQQPTNVIGREQWGPGRRAGRRLAWAREFDKLFAKDGRTPRQLKLVLDWVFGGDCSFVVHSPKALREKWDRITAVMQRNGHRGFEPEAPRFTPERVQQIVESTHRGSIWGSGKPQRQAVQARTPGLPDSGSGES